MPHPSLRALIWDVDGTLAETERDGHRVAFNRAFAEAGLSWRWDEASYGELLRVTGGKERIAAWWQAVEPTAAGRADAAATIARLHAAKSRHYEALVAAGAVALRPGVERLLRAARDEGLVLAIATTTQPGNVSALLEHTLGADAPGWFACIGAGDVVPAKKPAPDIYHHVLRRLGLGAAEALAIEDSQPGVQAANAAGVPVLAVRSVYTRHDELAGAVAVLDTLDALDTGNGGDVGVTLGHLRAWHARAVLSRTARDAAPRAPPRRASSR